MNYKLIIVLLLCLGNRLNAQTDFRAGYIITNSNDTAFGEIDYRGDILMGKLCRFKTNGNVVDYSPSEIAAYRFTDDGKYFVSKELNGIKTFLQFLIKGQVNVYSYRGDDSYTHFYIEKEDMPLSELVYEEEIVREDGKLIMRQSKKHIGLLRFYMQDAPSLQPQIENIIKPRQEELLKVAKNYHYAVCLEGEDCIVFEKKKPLFKLSVDAVIGIVNYLNDDDIQLYGGALCNIWLPRSNEKLYLRTGLLYTNANADKENNNKNSIWKIPFMAEYIYPKSVFRPKAAYGLGLLFYDNSFGGHLLGFMGGLNIFINRSLSCSLEYNIDFEPSGVPMIPGRYLSQAFLGGISIRF